MSSSASRRPAGTGRGKRVTIADIARRAGVTSAAVSLAVNGRPGVSDATRERIMAIARDLQWEPSPAARALAGAPVQTVGMVLARPAEVLGTEAFFGAFVAGLQEVLSRRDYSLQMQIVETTDAEIETFRRWFAQRRVDGVVVVDLREHDPRIPALEEIGLPALVVGGPGHHGSLPSVYVDDAHATELLVDHLAQLGHRRLARVAGNEDFLHTLLRDRAFEQRCADLGIEGILQVAGYGSRGAEIATAELMARSAPPSAIIFDSDEMVLAGAHVLQESGSRIPVDVAVASYEDSALTRTHRPPITAIGRSAIEYGRVAATRLLEVIEESRSGGGTAPAQGSEARATVPALMVRESTGPDGARGAAAAGTQGAPPAEKSASSK